MAYDNAANPYGREQYGPEEALTGKRYDVNGALVEDYDDEAACCSACGVTVTHGHLAANPAILDGWLDCGDECYCPRCR